MASPNVTPSYDRTKFSLALFGIYLIVVGAIGLGCFPRQFLSLLGFKNIDNNFTRMTGLVATCLGANYLLMVRTNYVPGLKFSIIVRYLAALAIAAIVFVAGGDWNLLTFTLGDGLGATWTWYCLRQEESQSANKKN